MKKLIDKLVEEWYHCWYHPGKMPFMECDGYFGEKCNWTWNGRKEHLAFLEEQKEMIEQEIIYNKLKG